MFGRTVGGGLITLTGGHMTLQLAGNQTGTETAYSWDGRGIYALCKLY